MMIFAEVSSGRSDLASASPTKEEMPGSSAAATGSIGAAASPACVAANEAVRIVAMILASVDSTVWMALPA